IHEKVPAAKLLRPGEVCRSEGAAHNRGGRVVMDRAPEPRVGSGPVLHGGPAVVGTSEALVDLLANAADIVDEDPARTGLHSKREWVTQPQRPDGAVLAVRPLDKGVVRRDRAVAVKPQQLA